MHGWKQAETVFLVEVFKKLAEERGYETVEAKAKWVGCGLATMSRMLRGGQRPGGSFIAGVKTAEGLTEDEAESCFRYEGRQRCNA